MPLDPSISLNIQQPKPVNPLETFGTMAATMNALNQNKLFGQTFAARQAIGQAYQQSIDPATGEVDTNKLLGLVAKDPNAGFMAGDVAQQALARKQAQLGISGAELDQANKRLGTLRSTLGSLLANPSVTSKDVISATGQLIADGVLTPQIAASELANMPQDQVGLRGWLQNHLVNTLDAQQKVATIFGTPTVINTGGQTNVVAASPMTGVHGLGTLQNTMTPGEAVTPTPALIRNPDGSFSPSTVTRQQFAGMTRQGPVLTSPPLTASGLSPAEAAARVPTFANGQPGSTSLGSITPPMGGTPAVANPGSLRPGGAGLPSGRTVDQAIAPAAAPSGFVPTGPALGQEAAANAAGGGAGKALADAQQAATGFPARMFQLDQALRSLQNTSTGPGTDTTNYVKSFLLAQTPDRLKSLGIVDADKIKNYDEANKYLTQYAMSQAGALGQGTDEKLATALTGNANTHISNLAAQDVVKANMALERMKQAGVLSFQQSGQGPQDFNKYMTTWASGVDPRAFALDTMDPKHRTELLNTIRKAPASEQKKFANSYNLAVQSGLMPDLAAPSGAQ